MSNNFAASLVKELCVICAKEIDGPIIMTKRLTPGNAKKVREMHGKAIGFSEEHCKECQENMKKAFMFIGFDEEKSDLENLPEGFYRTGHIVGTKKDIPLVQEFVKEHNPSALKHGFIFMQLEVMKHFGLVKVTKAGHELKMGKKGGWYYINSNGNKTYVKQQV